MGYAVEGDGLVLRGWRAMTYLSDCLPEFAGVGPDREGGKVVAPLLALVGQDESVYLNAHLVDCRVGRIGRAEGISRSGKVRRCVRETRNWVRNPTGGDVAFGCLRQDIVEYLQARVDIGR